jgi:hypothetical protein
MSVVHLGPLRANGRERRSTPAQLGVLDAANGPRFRALATLCVAVVGALSAVVLVQTVGGWL